MRALKRRLPGIVYHRMVAGGTAAANGPGRALGDDSMQSSVTGLTPIAGSSDKPLSGPAARQPMAISAAAH